MRSAFIVLCSALVRSTLHSERSTNLGAEKMSYKRTGLNGAGIGASP